MSRGGARVRSGPAPDPSSGRSEKRKYLLTALPVDGYSGPVPKFPLPADGDVKRAAREKALWRDAWRSPQACAWSMEAWRTRIVAQYCRVAAVVELDPSASAALVAQLHRFRDQLGLTPAGLRHNGWRIADAPVELRQVVEDRPQRRRSRELSA